MNINLSVGFISYAISFGVHLAMLIIFIIGQREGKRGKPFVILILMSVLWSGLLLFSQIGASASFLMITVAELLRYSVWIFVMQFALGAYSSKQKIMDFSNPLAPINSFIVLILSFIALLFNQQISTALGFTTTNLIETLLQLIFPILGLMMAEQLYRNTEKERQWHIIYLCLTAAAIFGYDVIVYSNALLWGGLNYEFWSARGLINVLVLPLLILAAVRNPTLSPRIYISRHVVFHSLTLSVSGLYLVLISAAAYFLKLQSEEWGGLLQISVVFAGVLFLLYLFLTSSVKIYVKNYLYSNFFSNKYDYRDEWHRFSNTLLIEDGLNVNVRALKAVSQILESKGAALWLTDDRGLSFRAVWSMTLSNQQKQLTTDSLMQYVSGHKAIFTLSEYSSVTGDQSLNLFWLAIPLWNGEELIGVILASPAIVDREIDQEDKELLSTIGHHLSLYFSQNKVAYQLMEAQKFQHINQMTAFLVHDLKTVLSQLLLMVENAKVHKSNPDFIDDMIETVEHVATKMQRLILQLKKPNEVATNQHQDIHVLLVDMLSRFQHGDVIPQYTQQGVDGLVLEIDIESFSSALKHLVQNALDALSGFGEVSINAKKMNDELLIEIADNGSGMSEQFITERLFQPFDSSKGVSGLGIGVYQSREYIRSLNGDIKVESQLGKGSVFRITIPIK